MPGTLVFAGRGSWHLSDLFCMPFPTAFTGVIIHGRWSPPRVTAQTDRRLLDPQTPARSLSPRELG